MKLKFLVVGDIHFEKLSTYLPDKDYLTPVYRTLKQIWKYAKDNGIENIFIAGDVFDTPYPRDNAKKAFLKSLDRDLKYYIILGNHDIATTAENSLMLCKYFVEDLGLMENVKFFFEPSVLNLNGVTFNLLPFPYKEPTIDPPAICIGHFEAKGFMSDTGKIFKEGTSLNEKYTWILGHLHRRQKNIYPGSILQHSFGEPVNKYFFDCTVTDNNEIEIEAVSINTPYKMLDIVANTIEDIKLEPQNIYRIYAAEHLDLAEINEKCKGYNIWKIIGLPKNQKPTDSLESSVQYEEFELDDESYLRMWLTKKYSETLSEQQIEEAITVVNNFKKQLYNRQED